MIIIKLVFLFVTIHHAKSLVSTDRDDALINEFNFKIKELKEDIEQGAKYDDEDEFNFEFKFKPGIHNIISRNSSQILDAFVRSLYSYTFTNDGPLEQDYKPTECSSKGMVATTIESSSTVNFSTGFGLKVSGEASLPEIFKINSEMSVNFDLKHSTTNRNSLTNQTETNITSPSLTLKVPPKNKVFLGQTLNKITESDNLFIELEFDMDAIMLLRRRELVMEVTAGKAIKAYCLNRFEYSTSDYPMIDYDIDVGFKLNCFDVQRAFLKNVPIKIKRTRDRIEILYRFQDLQ